MAIATEKKPWWKSKIILLGGTLLLVFGSSLLGSSLVRSGVTPEQIDSITAVAPQAQEIFERLQSGENITNLIGLIISALIIVARGWFTQTAKLGK